MIWSELYKLLKSYHLFLEVEVLHILACKPNDQIYGIHTDHLRDIFCCDSCDLQVFSLIKDEIKHLFRYVTTAALTHYIWETFKGKIFDESHLRDKISWVNNKPDYPQIVEYILTQITDPDHWRPLNNCIKLEERGRHDLSQRLKDAFNKDPPC